MGNGYAAGARPAVARLADALHRRLAAAFAAGANDPAAPVVAPAGLPGGSAPHLPVAEVRWDHLPAGGVPAHTVGVRPADLPAGHPARAALEAGPLYGAAGGPGWAVLGPSGCPWYEAGEAAALTRDAEGRRRQGEEDALREREGREREERRAWEVSPAGQAAALRRRVSELEAELARRAAATD